MIKTTNFEIKLSSLNNIEIISLYGYLDAHTAPILEKSIQDLILNNKYKIIVDMANLDYISSAGLGVFMAFIEEIRDKGGDIKLAELKPKVYKVFDLLGFPILFKILPTIDEAVQQFENN